jgi:hypothetical protein
MQRTREQSRTLNHLFNQRPATGSPVWRRIKESRSPSGALHCTMETTYWWGKVDRTEVATITIFPDGMWERYTVRRCDRPIKSKNGKPPRAKHSEYTVVHPFFAEASEK